MGGARQTKNSSDEVVEGSGAINEPSDMAEAMRMMAQTMADSFRSAIASQGNLGGGSGHGNAGAGSGPQTPRVQVKIDPPTYVGASDEKSPTEFLEALSQYILATGYDEGDVLRHVLPLCLKGAASRWFTFMGTFADLKAFKAGFRLEFQATDYARRLQAELDLRTQGVNEPLTEFVHCIAEFYRRMQSSATEADKVSRVMRQCHPTYRMYLRGKTFASLKELASEAKDIQSDLLACAMYRPPPSPFDTLEPTLAYGIGPASSEVSQGAPHVSMAMAHSSGPAAAPLTVGLAALDPYSYFRIQRQAAWEVANIAPRTVAPAPPSNSRGQVNDPRLCYKCNRPGHIRRDCPDRRGNGSQGHARNQ